ncbi:hypothetical protein KUCAC02_013246 [Chaenocephalus aceratus]|nr:hypothetical protein KUCAC02_013246 [Chaenocephalus aceratus]
MAWLAHPPAPRMEGSIGSVLATHPPVLIHAYGHTHKLGLQPPPPPPPILLGTGPRIGDMWLGEMRHDAGLRSLRQIWCPSACLQITSLERLTKTEKDFCFPPV